MSNIDRALKGNVPHYAAIKAGMKIARQQEKKSGSRKRKQIRLTEISSGSGKPVLCNGVGVSRAARKLYAYEETGLSPEEILGLIQRERMLTEKVKKLQDW